MWIYSASGAHLISSKWGKVMKKIVLDGVVEESADFTRFKGKSCVAFKILAHDVESVLQENESYNVVAFGAKNTLVNFIKFRKGNSFLFEGIVRRTRLIDSANVLDSTKYLDLHEAKHLAS